MRDESGEGTSMMVQIEGGQLFVRGHLTEHVGHLDELKLGEKRRRLELVQIGTKRIGGGLPHPICASMVPSLHVGRREGLRQNVRPTLNGEEPIKSNQEQSRAIKGNQGRSREIPPAGASCSGRASNSLGRTCSRP